MKLLKLFFASLIAFYFSSAFSETVLPGFGYLMEESGQSKPTLQIDVDVHRTTTPYRSGECSPLAVDTDLLGSTTELNRVVGRVGCSAAHANILLPKQESVETITYGLIKTAYEQAGYRILPKSSHAEGAIPVKVTVTDFWINSYRHGDNLSQWLSAPSTAGVMFEIRGNGIRSQSIQGSWGDSNKEELSSEQLNGLLGMALTHAYRHLVARLALN